MTRTTFVTRGAAALAATALLAGTLGSVPATAVPSAAPTAGKAVNKPPRAVGEQFTIAEDTKFTVKAPGVLVNDKDPERKPLTAKMVKGPKHGRAVLKPNGRLTYTPRKDWSGKDFLVYQVRDAGGKTDRARVRFTVTPVNDPPRMSMKATGAVEGGSSTVTITATDPENDPLVYLFDCGDGFSAPQQSNVHECEFEDDGSYLIRGRVRDSKGATITSALTVNVINRNPVVTPGDDVDGEFGVPIAVDLGSFADPGPDGPWQVTVNWGDGSPNSTFSVTDPGDLGIRNHTYADTGEPQEIFQVRITVKERGANGASGMGSVFVTVTD